MRKFEWDEEKAKRNLAEHGVGFKEAQLVFEDRNHLTEMDDRYDYGEERWQTTGLSRNLLLLVVAHTIWDEDNDNEVVRIISARIAQPHERRRYGNRKFLGR